MKTNKLARRKIASTLAAGAILAGLVISCRLAWCAEPPLGAGKLLTLRTAIELGLRNHPARLAAAAEAGAARERVGEAQSNLLPQILGAAQYLRATANGIGDTNYLAVPGFPRIGTGGRDVAQTTASHDNYLLGVSAYQYLFDFGRVRSFVEQRRAEAAAQQSNLRLTELGLIFQVAERYFGLLAAKQLVKVYERAATQRQLHLSESALKAKAGLTPQIDVYTAQANVARAQLALTDARNGVANAKVALDNAMGLGGPTAPDYELADVLTYGAVTGSISSYADAALRLRPDLKMLEDQARAAGAVITQYRSDYLPTVAATAGYSARAQGLPAANNLDAGVVISWPIFNGYVTAHAVEEAKLHQDAIRHAIEDLRQQIFLQVESAFFNWQTALERIHQAEQALAASRTELELAEKRYEAGLGSIIELTDADERYTQDDAAYVEALYSFSVAKAALDRATAASLPGV